MSTEVVILVQCPICRRYVKVRFNGIIESLPTRESINLDKSKNAPAVQYNQDKGKFEEPQLITQKQKEFILDLCRKKGVEPPQDLDYLDRKEASALIEKLKRM